MRFLFASLMAMVAVSSNAAIVNRPYLQAVTRNSIEVLVECTTPDTVSVEYGFTVSYGGSARTEIISLTTATPATYVHKVRLTGMLSDTVYHYRVIQSGDSSGDSWFRTAKPAGRSFRCAWMADSRTNSTIFDAVAALVAGKAPEVLLLGGDVCISGAYSAWQTEFFRPNALALISHVPFFFSVGNHEGWATNSMAFTHAPDSRSGSQDYYSFDYGDIHFLVLDTEVSYAPGSPQYTFAQNDLGATTQRWKIVACHKPAYCSGGHGEDAGMKIMTTNIFEPAGVDLVIGGHSHFYQHNLVHNLHHLVVGTSGAPMYVPTNASYTIRSVQDYCYAMFDVTPSIMHINVYNSSDVILDTLRFFKPPTEAHEPGTAPTVFSLTQNYPNPFNPSTGIRYDLPHSSHVTLVVYDILGRQVAQLVNEQQQVGYHDVVLRGDGLTSGVYFYRLEADGFVATKKLLLIR